MLCTRRNLRGSLKVIVLQAMIAHVGRTSAPLTIYIIISLLVIAELRQNSTKSTAQQIIAKA